MLIINCKVPMKNSNLDKYTTCNDLLPSQEQNIIPKSDTLKEFQEPEQLSNSHIQNENFIISEEVMNQ